MTAAEITSSIIAIFSLIISAITAYLTLLTRFKGKVAPKRRVILTQMNDIPYVVLECEFSNAGAMHGSIEDLMLTVVHPETGSEFNFAPQLSKSHFNIFDKYNVSDFSVFSGVSLGTKERRELYIAFKPLLSHFFPPIGLVKLRTSIKINGQANWLNSSEPLSLLLNEDIIKKWSSPPPIGEPQQIEALEIGISRQYLLEKKR